MNFILKKDEIIVNYNIKNIVIINYMCDLSEINQIKEIINFLGVSIDDILTTSDVITLKKDILDMYLLLNDINNDAIKMINITKNINNYINKSFSIRYMYIPDVINANDVGSPPPWSLGVSSSPRVRTEPLGVRTREEEALTSGVGIETSLSLQKSENNINESKNLMLNIQNNKFVPQYSHISDSESDLNVNNIIDTYQSSTPLSLLTVSTSSRVETKENDVNLIDQINTIKRSISVYRSSNTDDSYNDCLENQIKISLSNNITVEQKDAKYEEFIEEIKPCLTGRLLKETQHYDYLRGLPQPVQKSPEWYELRNGMITASAAADILGESKYHTRDEMLLDKINLLPNKYQENMFVHHGKKYERIATMIYEYIYNTKVGEFGLVPYQNDHTDLEPINFIGASPDGISTCITLDGKPNELVGRMLEIKCPFKRKIITEGEIDGVICPHYYWVQVQLQLACCKNDACDFWQCNLQEYSDDEWILDNTEDGYSDCPFTVEQNIKTYINPRLCRGCIIQLNPKTYAKVPKGDRLEWYAKYIYPSNLNMTTSEYIEWSKYMENNWQTLYPEYVADFKFDKILYWKLMNCHNLLIKRNIEWFNSKVPSFKQFWKEVLELRVDTVKSQQLLDKYMAKKNKNKDAKDAREKQYNVVKELKTNPLDDDGSLFLSDEAEVTVAAPPIPNPNPNSNPIPKNKSKKVIDKVIDPGSRSNTTEIKHKKKSKLLNDEFLDD